MFCTGCGAKLEAGQNFCPICGKVQTLAASAVNPPPGMPYPAPFVAPPRVESNIKLLGILWIVFSALHLIPGLFLMLFFNQMISYSNQEPPAFVFAFVQAFGVALSVGALLGITAGLGLLYWKPWARLFALVLGTVSLLNVPFGTGLGVFTFWVLLPAESEREYRQHAVVA